MSIHSPQGTGELQLPDEVEASRMPLMEHLVELRNRLVSSLVAIFIGCAITMGFAEEVWAIVVTPMNQALESTGRGTMAITQPLEGIITYLKVGFLAGFCLASPVVAYQAWSFVAPGLYLKERRIVIPLVFSSTTLFLLGVGFAYEVIFTYAFPFFLTITTEDVQAVLSMSSYLSLVTRLMLAFGFCFQLPVVVFFLAKIGLIHHRDMIHGFKYSIVGIFVVAAILTPPDVLSQLLMAIPMLALYGIGVVVAWIFSTKEVVVK